MQDIKTIEFIKKANKQHATIIKVVNEIQSQNKYILKFNNSIDLNKITSNKIKIYISDGQEIKTSVTKIDNQHICIDVDQNIIGQSAFVYGTYEKSPYIHTDKLNELTLVALKGGTK